MKWKQDFEQHLSDEIEFKSILIQDVDFFGDRIGFLKFKANLLWKSDGFSIPGIVFCRGDSVAVLVVLISPIRKYVVLVEQARVPIGTMNSLEMPVIDN